MGKLNKKMFKAKRQCMRVYNSKFSLRGMSIQISIVLMKHRMVLGHEAQGQFSAKLRKKGGQSVYRIFRITWQNQMPDQNTLFGNFIGVVFGVFMYFPTLVEVPIAQMFLELGMHRGPLLAYLISDPELSLQSILITAAIIGRLKAWVYSVG